MGASSGSRNELWALSLSIPARELRRQTMEPNRSRGQTVITSVPRRGSPADSQMMARGSDWLQRRRAGSPHAAHVNPHV